MITDREGRSLDAAFAVDGVGTTWDVVFESRGPGGARARNPDYNAALEVVLERLVGLEATLVDALLVSRETEGLDATARRLAVGRAYPISLKGLDAHELRLELGRAQAVIRRPDARGGGNRTKRILLRIATPFSVDSPDYVERLLARGI